MLLKLLQIRKGWVALHDSAALPENNSSCTKEKDRLNLWEQNLMGGDQQSTKPDYCGASTTTWLPESTDKQQPGTTWTHLYPLRMMDEPDVFNIKMLLLHIITLDSCNCFLSGSTSKASQAHKDTLLTWRNLICCSQLGFRRSKMQSFNCFKCFDVSKICFKITLSRKKILANMLWLWFLYQIIKNPNNPLDYFASLRTSCSSSIYLTIDDVISLISTIRCWDSKSATTWLIMFERHKTDSANTLHSESWGREQ